MKRKFLIFIIPGIVILFLFYSQFDIRLIAGLFRNFRISTFIGYSAAVIIIDFILVLRWNIILRSQKVRLPFWKLYLIKTAGYAVGYVTPQMHLFDASTKFYLLKKEKVDMKKAITATLIDRSMRLSSDAIFAAAGLTLIAVAFALPANLRLLTMSIALVIGFLFGMSYYLVLSGKPFLSKLFLLSQLHRIKQLKKAEESIKEIEQDIYLFFRLNKKTFVLSIFLNLLLWAAMFSEYRFALMLLGFEAKAIVIFLTISAVGMAYSIPLPFAAGSLEGTQLFLNSLMGINPIVGASLSLLIRVKDMARTAFGLISLSYLGISWKQGIKFIKQK